MLRLFLMACLIFVYSGAATAGDWPQFRGPGGDGRADAGDYPIEWSPEKNIKWKVPLPAPANSSPIVSAGRVFVTVTTDRGTQRSLLCFDRATGEPLWTRTVEFDQEEETHKTNPHAPSTPAADGQRVVVWHGSAGLFCYDFAGEQLWRRDLGEIKHMWGFGSSPVIDGQRIFMNVGPSRRNYVAAIDLQTGESIWETDEPHHGDGDRNEAGKYMGSWSTPVLADVGDRRLVICPLPTRLNAYDAKTGAIVWSCQGIRGPRGDLAYSSAILGDSLVVAFGGFRGPAIGVRIDPASDDDVTESHRLWRTDNENPQNIGTGVLIGDHIFKANAGPSTIECIEAATGRQRWEERSPAGNHWGSVIFADGRLYSTGQSGKTVVFAPNPERLEVIAVNPLNESSNATPAFSDGEIFIRTDSHLYCIAKP